eukprot:CAMPEP_0170154012 /NCGR_PEP_ID=MMETSP0033_2-20121228/56806_1 /TAXON_ID=195969 /ORGANISM="Dolichomastix tenuilepis, Strain CCMP3274" /LENGTH=120 /DNA_ID=CAMNT_0010391235 /DNA_START=219 /DNA_END=581 /DNA_ORIENTATION=-
MRELLSRDYGWRERSRFPEVALVRVALLLRDEALAAPALLPVANKLERRIAPRDGFGEELVAARAHVSKGGAFGDGVELSARAGHAHVRCDPCDCVAEGLRLKVAVAHEEDAPVPRGRGP